MTLPSAADLSAVSRRSSPERRELLKERALLKHGTGVGDGDACVAVTTVQLHSRSRRSCSG